MYYVFAFARIPETLKQSPDSIDRNLLLATFTRLEKHVLVSSHRSGLQYSRIVSN